MNNNNNLIFTIVPLDDSNLGIILSTSGNDFRAVIHKSSEDSVHSLLRALYYLHPDADKLDTTCRVEYFTRTDDNALNTSNTVCYEDIKYRADIYNIREDTSFVPAKASLFWYEENDCFTNLTITKSEESNPNPILHIEANLYCQEPEHWEYYIPYADFCTIVLNGCEKIIADIGQEEYNKRSGNKPFKPGYISFLKNITTNS